MRGEPNKQGHMFSYVSIEDRIPNDHPIRRVKDLVDPILERMSDAFDGLYSDRGRPSIPPEQLLRALLLQALFTIRSERQLMEQLDYNLMFRWFVGLDMDAPVWDATVYSKNRERLLKGDIARRFFVEVLETARRNDLLSDEHFTVDGTLIEAWAGHKSFKPKDDGQNGGKGSGGGSEIEKAIAQVLGAVRSSGQKHEGRNKPANFHGEKRTNDTHQSTTDPESRLFKKGGDGAKLRFMGHVLMENRNGLVVDVRLTTATGTAESEAAIDMIDDVPGTHQITVGADKSYDNQNFVQQLRERGATPHVAQNNKNRRSAIDARTTRHDGYQTSQRKRKRVEEIFGWAKTIGGMRKTRHKGTNRVGWSFTLVGAVYNLVRIGNILAAPLPTCPA
jgi:transposase